MNLKMLSFKATAAMLKFATVLPDSWKIALSGKKPLVLGGRTLDPDLQLMAHISTRGTPIHHLPPAVAQRLINQVEETFAAKAERDIYWVNFEIASRASHKIPVRLYTPQKQNPDAPIMAYFHMGGGVIGSLTTCHAMCSILCSVLQCPIVSVDYRLAPQHKFPAGLEDCLDAYEWALKNAARYGAPAARATVGGSSMGGSFSAIIAQETRRQGIPMPDLQLLIYPATNTTTQFPSYTTYGDTYPLNMETLAWFVEHYLPEGQDIEDLLLQPGLEPRLEGLPPAIIATAGFDPLVDDGAAYASKLSDAGVDVSYKCYDDMLHGFVGFTALSRAARQACLDIAYTTAKAYAKLEPS